MWFPLPAPPLGAAKGAKNRQCGSYRWFKSPSLQLLFYLRAYIAALGSLEEMAGIWVKLSQLLLCKFRYWGFGFACSRAENTRELPWASCGCIWGDIWDKITPGFTVKSSFHLRNKENSKCPICAPCKCSFNCHERAGHKPRDFQNLKGKVAANALDISVTLFYAIDSEDSTIYFDEEGCWSHPFPHKKLKSPTATRQ